MSKAGKNMSSSEQTAALLKESQSLAKALGLEYENIVDLQELILNGQVKSNEQLLKQLQIARKAQNQKEDDLHLEERRAEVEKDILDLSKEMLNPLRKASSLTDDIYKQDLARIQKAKELGGQIAKEATAYEAQLTALNKMSKNPIITNGFSAAADSLDAMQAGIDGFIKKMPGGEFLSKALGIDKLSSKLQNSLIQGGKAGAVAAGLVIFAALAAVLTAITAEAKEFAKETGVTFSQARGIADQSKRAADSMGLMLATAKDVMAVQKETITAFGVVSMISAETAANIAEMGNAFGYGAQQAALVNNEFLSMGASQQQAVEIQRSLAAEAVKAGVSVDTVMKDVTANAKSAAKYFGGNVVALKNAAIEAAKLGVSLSTMTKVADQLLNIEQSLSSQYSYQAITGKQINLDLAREAALRGDIAGATKSILSQVGSIEELQAQGPVAMKALADATGMSVDELTKSLAIQQRLGDLTDEQQAAMNNLGLSAAEIKDLSDEQLQTRLAEQQSIDSANKSFDDMKNKLMTSLAPAAEALGKLFASLAPALELLSPIMTFLGGLANGLLWPFKLISDVINYISGLVTKLTDQFSFLGPVISFISDTIYYMGAIIGTLLIPNLIRAISSTVTLGMKTLQSAVPSIFRALSFMGPVGLAAAGVAVAGMMALYNSVGDLAMSAGGGPIVTNPREGTIFQGTKNDEVAMGPGVIGAAQRTQGVTMVAQQQQAATAGTANAIGEQNRILQQIAEGQKNPAPIQIGTQVIREINSNVQVEKSFNRMGRNNR